jgi:hypothetical protein
MLPGRRAALGLVLVLTAACGGGGDGSAAPSSSSSSSMTTGTAAGTTVPDVVVRDVATGGDVNLRTLGLPDRPTLYWFWAPH